MIMKQAMPEIVIEAHSSVTKIWAINNATSFKRIKSSALDKTFPFLQIKKSE